MKKILFLSLALLIAGATFADKKCCKDKKESSCNKEAKACCKKGEKKSEAKAEASDMPACCKKNVEQGKAACCSKKAEEKRDDAPSNR